MNKYPYIGKNSNLIGDFSIAIFYGEKRGALLENTIDCIPLHKHLHNFNESEFENITADYLRNTYGKVEGKEHAEFIVRLAEVNGFKLKGYARNSGYFYAWRLDDGSLFFSFCKDEKVATDDDEKPITIPLPPKDKSMESQKEWPVVGDDVKVKHGSGQVLAGELLAITKEYAVIQQVGHEQHLHLSSWEFSKPLTPEDELAAKIANAADSDDVHSVHEMIAKAIINGEVKGLEYKPQNNCKD